MHILMVDDEVDFLELMQNRLGRRGFTVSVAHTGEEGIKLLRTNDYAVIVLDMKMSDMDGLEALRRIRSIKPEQPVLILTGHASMEAAVTGVELGAADYLMKPVPITELVLRLQDAAQDKGLSQ